MLTRSSFRERVLRKEAAKALTTPHGFSEDFTVSFRPELVDPFLELRGSGRPRRSLLDERQYARVKGECELVGEVCVIGEHDLLISGSRVSFIEGRLEVLAIALKYSFAFIYYE